MNRIYLLEKEVAERIAAGEVVERPASIVKELLENSIDSGASSVSVEIKGGGIGYIRVSDDGSGIVAEDIPKAFMRHATSKVRSHDDLDTIGTLGFRGEALASIAAVAKVELTTRTPQDEAGTRHRIEGGIFCGSEPAGCPPGTTLVVRDVFYNTPARMKFLRKDVSEGNAVANIVEKCALSHPEIAFQFVRNGQVRLQTSGSGELLAVIYAVFGRETAAAMIPVEYHAEGDIFLSGYVSRPEAGKASRIYQNFFINGRYVRTRTCSAALEEAFKNKIMTGKYPACVLHLAIRNTEVDVNVHPAKIEIRFSQEKPVFNAVYFGVKTALSHLGGAIEPSRISLATGPQAKINPLTLHLSREIPQQQQLASTPAQIVTAEREAPRFSQPLTLAASRVAAPSLIISEAGAPIEYTIPAVGEASVRTQPEIRDDRVEKQQEIPVRHIGGRMIGELFRTYIALEQGEELLLVDKHAAHERILYEQLQRDVAHGNRQVLLSPVTVTLSMPEHSALLEMSGEVRSLGFVVEDFGPATVVVREVPMEISTDDLPAILSELAGRLMKHHTNLTPSALEQLYYSIACKNALRAGDKNDPAELDELLRLLRENPDITHCPHGRPICVRVKKSEIERMFGRLR